MSVRRLGVCLVFGLWTLFVWGGRLRNLSADDGGLAAASRWSLIGSVSFTVLGLAVVVLTAFGFRSSRSPASGWGLAGMRGAVVALAALTTGVWLVRAVDIAIEDHSAGFIAVHLVLAVVSITLAVLSVRAVAGTRSGSGFMGEIPGRKPHSAATEPGRSPVR